MLKYLIKTALLLILILAIRCQPDEPVDPGNTNQDTQTGMVEFSFPLPHTTAPADGIHRIDLSLAASPLLKVRT